MSARYRQLAAHVRRLADDDLNDLLVDLPTDRFTALVDAALAELRLDREPDRTVTPAFRS